MNLQSSAELNLLGLSVCIGRKPCWPNYNSINSYNKNDFRLELTENKRDELPLFIHSGFCKLSNKSESHC